MFPERGRGRKALFFPVLLSSFVLLLAGCINYEETVTIKPDGSGTVKVHCWILPELGPLRQRTNEQEFRRGAEEFCAQHPGLKLLEARLEREGDTEHAYVTFAFEHLKVLDAFEQFPFLGVSFSSAEGRITCTSKIEATLPPTALLGAPSQLPPMPQGGRGPEMFGEMGQGMRQMLQQMFARMGEQLKPRLEKAQFTYTVHFPGKVIEAQGAQAEGNKAIWSVRGSQLLGGKWSVKVVAQAPGVASMEEAPAIEPPQPAIPAPTPAERGTWKSAERFVIRLEDLPPRNARQHYHQGMTEKRLGQLERAIEHFRRALRLDEGYVDAHWALAWCYVEAGDVENATAEFLAVIEKEPDSQRAREAQKAIQQLHGGEVLAGVVSPAEQHYLRGLELKERARKAEQPEAQRLLDRAVAEFRQALALQPDYADAYWALAWTLAVRGPVREAQLAFQRVIDLEPDTPRAQEARAAQERLAERIRKAQEYLRKSAASYWNELALEQKSYGRSITLDFVEQVLLTAINNAERVKWLLPRSPEAETAAKWQRELERVWEALRKEDARPVRPYIKKQLAFLDAFLEENPYLLGEEKAPPMPPYAEMGVPGAAGMPGMGMPGMGMMGPGMPGMGMMGPGMPGMGMPGMGYSEMPGMEGGMEDMMMEGSMAPGG